jgi:hypothetical protein
LIRAPTSSCHRGFLLPEIALITVKH